jgi:ferredoxin--NADP+ reductase
VQFRLDYALSREQQNKRGGKMYIQDKVEEYADEVFDLLDKGAYIYFCGLKGMMPGAYPASVRLVLVEMEIEERCFC